MGKPLQPMLLAALAVWAPQPAAANWNWNWNSPTYTVTSMPTFSPTWLPVDENETSYVPFTSPPEHVSLRATDKDGLVVDGDPSKSLVLRRGGLYRLEVQAPFEAPIYLCHSGKNCTWGERFEDHNLCYCPGPPPVRNGTVYFMPGNSTPSWIHVANGSTQVSAGKIQVLGWSPPPTDRRPLAA